MTSSSDDDDLLAFAEFYLVKLKVAEQYFTEGHEDLPEILALLDRSLPQIEAAQAWCAETIHDEDATFLCSNYAIAARDYLVSRLHAHTRIRWHEAGLAAARSVDAPRREAAHLRTLGSAYLQLQETRETLDYLSQALEAYRNLDDREGEIMTLGLLGTAYYQSGDVHMAKQRWEERLRLARGTGDEEAIAGALQQLAWVSEDSGEREAAKELTAESASIVEKLADHTFTLHTNFRAVDAWQSGDRKAAAHHFVKKQQEAQSRGDDLEEGNVWCQMGDLALKDDIELAVHMYGEAAECFRRMGDREREGEAIRKMGWAYATSDRFDEAIPLYEQACTFFRETGNRTKLATVLHHLGVALASRGDDERAKAVLRESLDISRDAVDRLSEGLALEYLATLHERTKGEEQDAITLHEEAASIFQELGRLELEGIALVNLASVHVAQQRFDEALDLSERAFVLGERLDDRNIKGSALLNRGLALAGLGRRADGISDIEQATNLLQASDERTVGFVQGEQASNE